MCEGGENSLSRRVANAVEQSAHFRHTLASATRAWTRDHIIAVPVGVTITHLMFAFAPLALRHSYPLLFARTDSPRQPYQVS